MKSILIADDEESLRFLIATTLEDPEVRIFQAADGIETLEIARREHPDLIILDWMMPRLSGIDVVAALRKDPATAGLAIVMLTGMGHDRDRERGLALGIQGYLVKPFSPLQLIERVQEVLEREQSQQEDAREYSQCQ